MLCKIPLFLCLFCRLFCHEGVKYATMGKTIKGDKEVFSMVEIHGVNLPIKACQNEGEEKAALIKKASKVLHIREEQIRECLILKKAIDARKKEILYTYTLALRLKNEKRVLANAKNKRVKLFEPVTYSLPEKGKKSTTAPLIVGAGPGGLFCALVLAKLGLHPILIEQGKPVEERERDVSAFFEKGILDPLSNIQFGEGGAGTFSDGKLNTGTKDARQSFVLDSFIRYGAPKEIKYLSKPHVGTDILRSLLKQMRQELISLGCEFRFGHKLTQLILNGNNVMGAKISCAKGDYELPWLGRSLPAYPLLFLSPRNEKPCPATKKINSQCRAHSVKGAF